MWINTGYYKWWYIVYDWFKFVWKDCLPPETTKYTPSFQTRGEVVDYIDDLYDLVSNKSNG